MWDDRKPEIDNIDGDDVQRAAVVDSGPATTPSLTPPGTPFGTPSGSQPAPQATPPSPPQRASFSAIGSPPAGSVTPATGTHPQRPVAEVTATAPVAKPGPAFSLTQPASTFQPQGPATPPSFDLFGDDSSKKKRRTPFLVLLALFTILASGAVSYLVANNVADEIESAAPVPLPTAASAPTEPAPTTETTETTSATAAADASSLANEPFAVAAEIIRPSVVQLNLGQGLGTGIIINSNGTILTAAHVLGTETDVEVVLFDGSRVDGTVVGTDENTDVGVVQIDPEGRDLVVARLADGNDVRVGQIAVAVGSPFGFDQTVTAGIISAIDRVLPSSTASFVQTDAPINPGNSGGPLINLAGEVVGINDLIFTESGTSAGVGFAISIDLAVIIADQIVQGVEPQLALLGVSTGLAPNGDRGALVDQITPGSAAEASGLEIGDVIVGLNGTDVRGSGDLRAQVIDQAPGSNITITVLRDGDEVDLTATLGRTGG